MSDRPSVAIVGSGWWATANHLPALVKRADIQVEAICDLDEAKARAAADYFAVDSTYTDLATMLRERQLDAAVVATSHAAHYDAARQCLEAGLHVFIEKPMTLLATEARHLLRLARAQDKQIVMGYNHTHRPCTVRARELIQSGELGAIQYLDAQFSRPVSRLLAGVDNVTIGNLHRPGDVYGDPVRSGGGHGQLQLTHMAGMLFYATETRVRQVQARMAHHGLAVDLVVACSVEFENGALGAFGGTGHVSGGGQSTRLTIFCEKGWLDIDDTAGTLHVEREDGKKEFLDSGADADEAEQRYFFGPIHNFADVITGVAENHCSGHIGWRAVELLDAAYRSAARAGGAVLLEELYEDAES
ncbi:MAG: Gfo/Idh/MocA family oxidoreductase [Chloroflexi bacterium]|nr:Gfo/Idh/MocA family oxidoreductase [Chloroflexota bacterium]